MERSKKSSITTLPLLFIIIPTVILSFVFSIVAPRNIYLGNVESNKTELSNVVSFVIDEYEEHGFSQDLKDRINSQHEKTGIEFIVFKGEEEFMTTMSWSDENGEKFQIPEEISKKVINDKEDYFSVNVLFEKNSYCGYYAPIIENGNTIGIVFAAKNTENINSQIRRIIITIIAASWSATLAVTLVALFFMRRMRKDLESAVTYVQGISSGSLYLEMDERVLKRNDEIGDVGRSAKAMKESLECLINYDPLTSLINRRTCLEILKKYEAEDPSCLYVALGDLDNFKIVNDTYGHAAGDQVLQETTKIFREITGNKIHVSRWGGEEFLFVFSDIEEQTIENTLNEIISRIRIHKFESEGKEYSVTISIGLTKYAESIDKTISKADKNMYKAKEKGKNILVKE